MARGQRGCGTRYHRQRPAVEAGMGLSIVSRSTINKELKLGSLVAVELSPKLERPFSFVRQRYKFKSRAADELLSFAQQFCQDIHVTV